MSLLLFVAMFPQLALKDMIKRQEIMNYREVGPSGTMPDGTQFMIVRPSDIPTHSTLGTHNLLGIRLKRVKVLGSAALSHGQKQWLLSRRFAITREEFIT